MAIYTVQSDSLYAVADAIRAKGGTDAQLYFPDGFVSAIQAIDGGGGGGGGGEDPGKGSVHFIDYDGTLIKALSPDDVSMLSELPDRPSHDGLTAQDWNYTLSDIQAYVSTYPQAPLTIGQIYSTDDGSTRIYITIPEDTPPNRMTFPLVLDGSGATIDWGDGEQTSASAWDRAAYEHAYMSPGDYVITITSGQIRFGGSMDESDPTSCIYGARDAEHRYNASRIRKIELGSNVNGVSAFAFAGCIGLQSITIPPNDGLLDSAECAFEGCIALKSLTFPTNVSMIPYGICKGCTALESVSISASVGNLCEGAFAGCTALSRVAIPPMVSSIDNDAFAGCASLAWVTIPDGVSSIGDNALQGCEALGCVTIPGNVQSINSGAFADCYSIGAYHVKATNPPTLNDPAALTVAQDCMIYIPLGTLSNYMYSSGWSDYQMQFQEE